MKDRWIALYVENQVGVLAKISGLFAGKSYNLKSLTVGTTEEEDTSRITISTMCDDITFEQIKKQLNRMVEVIKVMDLTNVPIRCFMWRLQISAWTVYCWSASSQSAETMS